ncbi:MAG: carbamoyltransferase HypF, partial [Bacillota bacterium]
MEKNRLKIEIKGTVQGVGFRPFVYNLAKAHGLSGFVTNSRASVLIEVEGQNDSWQTNFLRALSEKLPLAARILSLTTEALEPIGYEAFEILESQGNIGTAENITPDLAICPDCLREIEDPNDRRYQYPFNNCTQCGPRFTIIREMPYDRKNTTMSEFEMCPECKAEYEDVRGRRFHAQPVSCPNCGPSLSWESKSTQFDPRFAPQAKAREALKKGEVLAIKGLGGYHLACDSTNGEAVKRLRERKKRDTKPFAIMVKNVATALELCEISEPERLFLESKEAPIVLLMKRKNPKFLVDADSANPRLGIMLAYTPLHHLLFQDGINALVMTSGNISSEPVCFRDEDAFAKLEQIADAFLTHDREIYFRNDDSVVQVFEDHIYPIRRSRGFVPLAIEGAQASAESGTEAGAKSSPQVLAFGADLKNTFAISKSGKIYPSHYVGDLENFEAVQGLEDGIAHFENIFEFKPEIIACDLHPGYVSTKLADEMASARGLKIVRIQHHYAHMLSCMADNGLLSAREMSSAKDDTARAEGRACADDPAKIFGLILDGTGFGTDGTIWGGELLYGNATSFERLGHIAQVPLLGGDLAVKQPWRNALSWVCKIYGEGGYADAAGELNANAASIPGDKGKDAAGELNANAASIPG